MIRRRQRRKRGQTTVRCRKEWSARSTARACLTPGAIAPLPWLLSRATSHATAGCGADACSDCDSAPGLLAGRFRASTITCCVGTGRTEGPLRPRSPECRLAGRSSHSCLPPDELLPIVPCGSGRYLQLSAPTGRANAYALAEHRQAGRQPNRRAVAMPALRQ